jgi:hypothetical protein
MKSAILDYTQKPKWSCYMDLHSLPPQGDRKPSLLMAKLTNTLPHGTPTNTDLFYSFFMFRMPQYLREVLAANEYTTARDMAVAADCVWHLRQSAPPPPPPSPRPTNPASGPPRRTSAAATLTTAAHWHIAAAEPRHLTQEEFPDNGICWYHNKFQNRSNRCKNPCNWNGPMPGRETARPPTRAHGPSGRRPARPISNSHSNGDVFFAQLRFNVFERFL